MKVRYLVFGFACFLGGMTAGFIYKNVNRITVPVAAKEAPKRLSNGIAMLKVR